MSAMYETLILAIPHATRTIHTEWSDNILISKDADRWTDWKTDIIFGYNHPQIKSVVGNVSRYDCDLERLELDPLETIGQGRIYTLSQSGARRQVSDDLRSSLIQLWEDYRLRLVEAIQGKTLILDCHSFPSDISNVDICIGFNADASKPPDNVLTLLHDHFFNHGYKVEYNKPYSNSITPATDKIYHSVMIEVNKRLYWDESLCGFRPCAYKLRYCLTRLYKHLITTME